MPYKYDSRQHNPPTVDDMYGEYKICQRLLPMSAFFDLYPEVTNEQLERMKQRYKREQSPIRYLWVPFSWLPMGFHFEPITVLRTYEPIYFKTGRHEGVSSTHLGSCTAILPSEEYVRIFLP